MHYPTTFEGTLIFSEGVGVIAGVVVGIQEVAIQKWLEDRWKGWLSAIRVIVFYTFVYTILFGCFALLPISSTTPDAFAEVSDAAVKLAIGLGLTLPTCNYWFKKLDQPKSD